MFKPRFARGRRARKMNHLTCRGIVAAVFLQTLLAVTVTVSQIVNKPLVFTQMTTTFEKMPVLSNLPRELLVVKSSRGHSILVT